MKLYLFAPFSIFAISTTGITLIKFGSVLEISWSIPSYVTWKGIHLIHLAAIQNAFIESLYGNHYMMDGC